MDAVVARSRHQLEEGGGGGSIGFYTSGQLFLEEYYTLGVIGRAGLGTPHIDGNTRLRTATAGEALKESFGAHGQPGSYTDVDHADTIALFGHNMAETQVVLWSRILDRRAGPNPPRLLCVDPRPTRVAREADVHPDRARSVLPIVPRHNVVTRPRRSFKTTEPGAGTLRLASRPGRQSGSSTPGLSVPEESSARLIATIAAISSSLRVSESHRRLA